MKLTSLMAIFFGLIGSITVQAAEAQAPDRLEELRKFGRLSFRHLEDINRRNVVLLDGSQSRVDIDPKKFEETLNKLLAPGSVGVRATLTRRVFKDGIPVDESITGRNYPLQLEKGLALELNETDLKTVDALPSPQREWVKKGFYFHEIFSISEGDPEKNRDFDYGLTKSFLLASEGGMSSGGGDFREIEKVANTLSGSYPSMSGADRPQARVEELSKTLVGVSRCLIKGYNNDSPGWSFTLTWKLEEEVETGGPRPILRRRVTTDPRQSGKMIATTSEIAAECEKSRQPYVQQFRALHPKSMPTFSGHMKFPGYGIAKTYFLIPGFKGGRAKKGAEEEALATCQRYPHIDAATCRIISPPILTDGGLDPAGLFSMTYKKATAWAEGKLTSPVEMPHLDLIAN